MRSAPTLCGSSTSSAIGQAAAPCPAISGSTWKYFCRQHFEVVQRPRHHRADNHRIDIGLGEAFELEQLVQPHGILVGGSPRVGRDPPAGLDLARVDQRKDKVGIPGIDGEQHASPLGEKLQAGKPSDRGNGHLQFRRGDALGAFGQIGMDGRDNLRSVSNRRGDPFYRA